MKNFIALLFSIAICLTIPSCIKHKYQDCSLNHQYKTLTAKNQKDLDRKKYKFKKPVPKQEDKKDTYSEEAIKF